MTDHLEVSRASHLGSCDEDLRSFIGISSDQIKNDTRIFSESYKVGALLSHILSLHYHLSRFPLGRINDSEAVDANTVYLETSSFQPPNEYPNGIT